MKKRFISIFLAVVLVLALAACGGGGNKNTIKIGLAAPLTGGMAAAGEMVQMAAEMAVSDINAAGGVNGKTVELVVLDDKNDPTEAANVAQRFIEDDDIVAVIGHVTSTTTLAALPIYKSAGMPVICPTGTSAEIKGYDRLLRIVLNDNVQGPQLSAMAINNLEIKRASILYANNDLGIGLRDQIISAFDDAGLEIASTDAYTPGADRDFSVHLSKVQRENPDAVFICGDYNEAGLIIYQAANLGGFEDVKFMGDASTIHQLFLDRVVGTGLESNVFLCCGYNPFDQRAAHQTFLANFSKVYDGEANEASVYTYDSVTLICKSLEAGAKGRDDLVSTVKGMSIDLVLGEGVRFGSDGERSANGMDILSVSKDGGFVYVDSVDLTGFDVSLD